MYQLAAFNMPSLQNTLVCVAEHHLPQEVISGRHGMFSYRLLVFPFRRHLATKQVKPDKTIHVPVCLRWAAFQRQLQETADGSLTALSLEHDKRVVSLD